MAIDRNRIIHQAERLVAHGKIEAAIAQYDLLVKDNPRDMNTINKIGDLYSRLGKKKQAIVQFSKIGEFYAQEGFLLKAVAIYKKIAKLDASRLDSYERLATLYAQQGLVLEARAQYQTVAERYVKAGDTTSAIRVYQDLVKLDPDNIKLRGALAELIAADGRPQEAVEQYTSIGAELDRRGMHREARAVYERAESLQPGSVRVAARVAASHLAEEDLDSASRVVQQALRRAGEQADLLALLADIHTKAGRQREAEAALRRALELAPGQADLNVRLGRLHLADGDVAGAFASVAEHATSMARSGSAPEIIALLEEILGLEEDHREALGCLAQVYEAAGNQDGAVRCLARLLDLLLDAGDNAEARRIAQKLVGLRPAEAGFRQKLDLIESAQRLPAPPQADGAAREEAVAAGPEASPPSGDLADADVVPDERLEDTPQPFAVPGAALDLPPPLELDPDDEDFIAEHMTEADVFVKYGLGDRAVDQLKAVTERFAGYAPAHAKLKEIYLEEGSREAARAEMIQLVKAHLAAGETAAAGEALAELHHFDPEGQEAAELGAVIEAVGAPAADAFQTATAGAGGSGDPSPAGPADSDTEPEPAPAPALTEEPDERVPTAEELQQVDACLQERQRDEAVALLRKLAESCGSHPEIVSRMRRAMAMPAQPLQEARQEARPPRGDETGAGDRESEEVYEITLEEDEEPDQVAAPSGQAEPEAREASASEGVQEADGALTDLSDLASEIDAALSGEGGSDDTVLAGTEAEPEGHSLEEIVEAFKKGIEHQIGAEDFDTHYNLGIAYKEMGLLDEAIGEFQFAAKDARLLVDCCSMLGICFREKGMPALAVKWYRRGLEANHAGDEEMMLGLRYDLAELLVQMGELREAMQLYTEVFGTNSKYRDVAARIKELERLLAG